MHVAELTLVDGSSMYPFMNEDKDSTLRRDVVLNYKWSPQDDLERGMVVTLRLVYICRGVMRFDHRGLEEESVAGNRTANFFL